jgi:outer membrane protein OmpA-like peptidoglycan-associated protein
MLPEAIALRSKRDRQLGRVLAPTIETALRESIRRNPRDIASAIFPVLGPAIRKAIAETMAELVRSINSAVEHSFSVQGIKWRIEAWRTGVRYADVVIKHALVYRVEQVFLIHADTGLLLAHVTAPDLSVPDADLISGMLTAIQDFVRDSFRPAEGGTLSEFTVGELSVHVEPGPHALIACVVRGQAPESVSLRAQQTLEQIHQEYATPLADFEGNAVLFESAAPLLEANLETVLSTRSDGKRKTRPWLRWAVPLLTLLLVALGFAIVSRVRWNDAKRVMAAEPGFMVVDEWRSWGRWNFRGLKDPLARDPRIVFETAGLIAPDINAEWKPYLSLDPEMVRARGRQAIDSAVRRLLTRVVYFDPGSSMLSAAEQGGMRALADEIRDLSRSVAATGASLRIDLVGRTDPSGTDATNQSLAGLRVAAVKGRLSDLGVPAIMLNGRPLATAQPLRAADPGEQARINRSVSFEAVVTTATRTREP